MKKNVKKGIVVACLAATVIGACYYVASSKTTRGRQDELQAIEATNESQAKPETQTTTTEETNKVEASQPVESYNDSIETTNENVSAPKAETTTGSTTNKVVVEDNSEAVVEADEEIREAESNGATVVESEETGVTAVSENKPQPAPAEEEEKETQKRVDLNFSTAIDATNEK